MAKYNKDCVIDGTPFTSSRRDKLTCSPACQKKLQRGGFEVTDETLSPPTEEALVDFDGQGNTPQADAAVVPSAAEKNTPKYEHTACDEALQNNNLAAACAGCRGEEPVDTPPKKNKSEPKAPKINVPITMRERMAASRQRMNERLRAKGLPLILEKPEPEYFVPTGIGEFDALTAGLDVKGSGGLPRKRITEIYGPKGVGKSSLVKTIMKMNPELRVLFFDAEGGMVGPPENMEVVKGNVVEDIMPALIEAVQGKDYDLIILDSIASLITRKQFEDDPEGKAAMARVFGPQVKRLVAFLQPLVDGLPDPDPGVAVVFINQFRSTTQAFGTREYTVGGKAMEYYASLRLEFRSAKSDYIVRNGKLAGQQVRVKVEKTRFGPKDVEFKFPIMFAELQDFNDHYMATLKELGIR